MSLKKFGELVEVDVNQIFVVIVRSVLPKFISLVRHSKKLFRMVPNQCLVIDFGTNLAQIFITYF